MMCERCGVESADEFRVSLTKKFRQFDGQSVFKTVESIRHLCETCASEVFKSAQRKARQKPKEGDAR